MVQNPNLANGCAGAKSAWEGWLKGGLQAALAGAPLDMAEAWGVAVRFAVHSLAHTHPAGLSAVLEVVMQPPPQGSYAHLPPAFPFPHPHIPLACLSPILPPCV